MKNRGWKRAVVAVGIFTTVGLSSERPSLGWSGSPNQALEWNQIFIDTLIILIGELLTNSILRTAWGDDVVNDAGTEHRT